jgi:MFS superfamily sulfate permease-like transporter
VNDEKGEWRLHPAVPGTVTEPGLVIYWFGAPLFYANSNRFSEEICRLIGQTPGAVRWIVVDAGPITRIDYTAARSLRQLKEVLERQGVHFAFAHVGSDLRADLDRHHLTEVIGPTKLFDSLHEALAVIRGTK